MMSSDLSRDKVPLDTRSQRWRAYGAAVLAGAVGTPLVILTVDTLPIILPAMLYSALAFFFAWLAPSRSGFRWGILVTLGIPLAVLVGIFTGVITAPSEDPSEVPIPYASLWGAVLLVAITPGLVGAIAGGVLGRWVARR